MVFSTNFTGRTQFIRHPAIDGLEVRHVTDTSGTERTYFSRYHQFLISASWSGTVWHRQRETAVRPGDVLEAFPGELMSSRRGHGELYCVTISKHLFERSRPPSADWGVRHDLNALPQPASSVYQLHYSMQEQLPVYETERCLQDLLAALSRSARTPAAMQPRADWEETRDLLQRVGLLDDATFDLGVLSAYWGRSRFSALRAFKRRFGLPPLSYQIHLRVEQAQVALSAGERPTRVAADCGFFDQSHLTRHFKRILGTTPAQYARAGARRVATSEACDFAGQALIPLRRIGQFLSQKIDHGTHFRGELSH